MTATFNKPDLYLTMPHQCSYLENEMSTTLFVDPQYVFEGKTFSRFMQMGFRRSGNLVYRPHCGECRACISVRIPVADFRPNRGQRRVWKRNRDVAVRKTPTEFNPAHFELYQRYQAARHPDGIMADVTPEKYEEFLTTTHTPTAFYEFSLHDELMAVAVTDELEDGLSAIYTFFDPALQTRAPGVFAILWQIQLAQSFGLGYLYLGYWIRKSTKMAYKANYRPLEAFQGGRWQTLDE